MTDQGYEVYVQTVEEQQRRHMAVTWFMGWLAGYTDSGGVVDGSEIEAAQKAAEKMFDVKILGTFGPSESPGEETP